MKYNIHSLTKYGAMDVVLPIEIWAMILGALPIGYRPIIRATCSFFRDGWDMTPRKDWVDVSRYNPLRKIRGIHISALHFYCAWASSEGYLNILRWLVEKGKAPLHPFCIEFAASKGYMELLKYLHSQKSPWSSESLKKIVYHKDKGKAIEMLKWVFSLSDPPSDKVCYCNTFYRDGDWSIEIMKIIPRGSWCGYCCHDAARGGNLKLLKWLRSLDPPYPWNREGCLEVASFNMKARVPGTKETVEWIETQK